MLRITTHYKNEIEVFQLEGKLAGPWVPILRDCWESRLAHSGGKAIQVDLRAVTFVDAAGKALLTEMYAQNAQFHASDCQMKATLDEITRPVDDSL